MGAVSEEQAEALVYVVERRLRQDQNRALMVERLRSQDQNRALMEALEEIIGTGVKVDIIAKMLIREQLGDECGGQTYLSTSKDNC